MAFSTHDQVPDSPTNVFAALNPLSKGSYVSTSDGNLTLTGNTATNSGNCLATIGNLPSGLWYWEYRQGVTNSETCGITLSFTFGTNQNNGENIGSYGVGFRHNGDVFTSAGSSQTTNTWTTGDIVKVCVDIDNGSIYLGKNTSWFNSGDPTSGALKTGALYTWTPYTANVIPIFGAYNNGSVTVNFGQDHLFGGATLPSGAGSNTPDNGIGQFAFAVPTGALALCTANLPDPAIDPAVDDLPADYFKAVTYTGQTVGGAMTSWNGTTGTVECGFQPDLVWGKNRDFGNYHEWTDSVRGATHSIFSNEPNAEETNAEKLKSFDSNGFSIGNAQGYNKSGDKHVAWCWKAGGAPTADNSNTSGAMAANSVSVDGTLQSSYTPSGSPTVYPTRMSVNKKAGFSIIKYGGSNATGLLSSSVSSATIPHGLSGCDFCIIKNLDNANTWVVSHSSIAPNVMSLQDAGAANSTPPVDPTYGQITTLGSNTVTITRGTSRGDNVGENLNSWNYIMYCWHSVAGYSAFGSYTGNGSTDGPFVYTGFKPAWVMVKNISTSGSGTSFSNWSIFDSARPPYNTNPANNRLEADTALAEDGDGKTGSGGNGIDMLSNGFKLRAGDWYETNHSSSTYIYAAFAEQPFKYANAR